MPVMLTRRISYTAAGRPVLYVESKLATDRFPFFLEFASPTPFDRHLHGGAHGASPSIHVPRLSRRHERVTARTLPRYPEEAIMKRRTLLAGALAGAGALAAKGFPVLGRPPAAAAQPAEFNLRLDDELLTLDPALMTSGEDYAVAYVAYSGLVRQTPGGAPRSFRTWRPSGTCPRTAGRTPFTFARV